MTSIREISFHRTRNSILLERVSGVSIMCCCRAGVSSFSFSCLRGRGRRGERGDSVALLSVVNSGNKGAAKRKLHRNKISSSLSPSPRATGVLLPIFRLHCLLGYRIGSPLITNQSSSPKDFQRLPLTKLHPSTYPHQRNATVSISNFTEFPSVCTKWCTDECCFFHVRFWTIFKFEFFGYYGYIYILELFLCKLYRNDYCIVNRVVYNIRV